MSSRITRSCSAILADPSNVEVPRTSERPTQPNILLRHKTSKAKPESLSEPLFAEESRQLSRADFKLLTLKQRKLKDVGAQVPTVVKAALAERNFPLADAASATLIFAWKAAGTAVCVSPEGLLLTCSHCVAESEEVYDSRKEYWLIFASGDAVKARCVSWDPIRDLALLRITTTSASLTSFPHIRVSETSPRLQSRMLCIGHPGSEDFEADEPGVATSYDVLHISEGRYRGMAKNQDPQDNSEIGALMHDCWTYWGHSGAPLISKSSGKLVGLHSSWDDETAMRRGVGWEALKAFLDAETVPVDTSQSTS